MILYVFKIHAQSNHADGMILVIADSAMEARQYILEIRNRDVYPKMQYPKHSYARDGKFVCGDDVVTLVQVAHKVMIGHVEWYLAGTFELKDQYVGVKGVQFVSYHDR